MDAAKIKERILELKKTRNAVILAHNYQIGEVQDIADFTGDSLGLARKATEVECDTIVFCGVSFMAETAKILSPDKTVLLPVQEADCPMANMATAREVREWRKKYPDAIFAAYVNTTAEVKAEVDICVTSSNALDVVAKLPDKPIVFLPDKNLATYTQSQLPEKKIIPWDGFCYVHNDFIVKDAREKKELYPDYPMLIHPESPIEVLEYADLVTSTAGMIKYVRDNKVKKAVIGTEIGLIHQLLKIFPDGEYIPLSDNAICVNMKRTSLNDLLFSLENKEHQIELNKDMIEKAQLSLKRMLAGKLEI